MVIYKDLIKEKNLSPRGDTNSQVDLVKEKNTDNFYVRKIIYGLETPLYRAVFTREINALYKLNKYNNIVKILHHETLVNSKTKEKFGVIYLERIYGENLNKTLISNYSSKEKYKIIKQIIDAIKCAHSNRIIHRDINPNNIMIDENNDIKIIDFGTCKIKDMINLATVRSMSTNAYTAPEINVHSENASEKSDLYSIGAVIYFLFTGNTPPLPSDFQNVIDKASGFDTELRPILRKLVAENPDERFEDIFELEKELIKLFARFIDVQKVAVFTFDSGKFDELKRQNLIPKNYGIRDAVDNNLPDNFSEIYAFSNNTIEKGENEYTFLGLNFSMDCIYDEKLNLFRVIKFSKIVPYVRENLKKRYAEIITKVRFIDSRTAPNQKRNDSLEIKNMILDYCAVFNSKNNVNNEFISFYGVWKELLLLIKEEIEKNIIRLQYDSFKIENEKIVFTLSKGVFIDDDRLNKEQNFIYEKKRETGKTKTYNIGTYENDTYINEHVILTLRIQGKKLDYLQQSGHICIDYNRDLINVQRQLDALTAIEKEDYSCTFNLKRLITGIDKPDTKPIVGNIKYYNDLLDMSQQTAVNKALNSENIAIIQGPPGTGKTNVIIEIIRQILKQNSKDPELEPKKILIVSQSHPAVDKMVEDLIKQYEKRPELVRVGKDEKLNSSIREEYGLDYVVRKWVKEVKENCRIYSEKSLYEAKIDPLEFEQYFKELEKSYSEQDNVNTEYLQEFQHKTSGAKSERIRKILEIQMQWYDELFNYEELSYYKIKSTTIIAGTCTGFSSNRIINDINFDYVIIDEAAKATFPELAISLNKAQKIIMVGDHKQLPPVLKTDIIKKNPEKIDKTRLEHGIFEKLFEMFPNSNKHTLSVQYRMHPIIGTLISETFYDRDIQNGISSEQRTLPIEGYDGIAIEWISTSKQPFNMRREKPEGTNEDKTYKNDLEKDIIKLKLKELDQKLNKKTDVAIITAYSAQKYSLFNMVRQMSFKNIVVEVDTVDAFQGNQKEIILYSTVRSSKGNTIGFLKSEPRLNVAFSRAQCLLIIVGDMNFLNNRKFNYGKFPEIIEYIKNTDGCRIVEC